MKFQPRSSHEIDTANLYQPGEYDFEVMSADNKTSKNGNEMIALKVKVFGTDGGQRHVYDHLMSLEKVAYKLRHFCEATGLIAKYEAGSLEAADCELKTGRLVLAIDSKNKDYPPKNVIRDYITPAAEAERQEFEEDAIPF